MPGRAAVLDRKGASPNPRCSVESYDESVVHGRVGVVVQRHDASMPLEQRQRSSEAHNKPIGIIGGGVSGIWSAIALAELGYTNITILERELRVGGKAAAFEVASCTANIAARSRRLMVVLLVLCMAVYGSEVPTRCSRYSLSAG